MSKTSKKYFGREFKEIIWNGFLQEIKKIKTRKSLEQLIAKVLTENERIMLEKRLAILYLLGVNKTYREISREVDVTLKTVNFVKNGLKRPPEKEKEYKPITRKDLKERKSRFPAYRGKGRWRFLDVSY